jgi:hypothetical protein
MKEILQFTPEAVALRRQLCGGRQANAINNMKSKGYVVMPQS